MELKVCYLFPFQGETGERKGNITEKRGRLPAVMDFYYQQCAVCYTVMDCDDQQCAVCYAVMDFVISTWKSFSNDCLLILLEHYQ